MKTILINQPVNVKWLTRELQAAGVNVLSVAYDDIANQFYTEVDEAHEALALTIIEAHDPANNPDILERSDVLTIRDKIDEELTWLNNAITNFDSLTAAQKLELLKRVLVQQRQKYRALKFLIRKVL